MVTRAPEQPETRLNELTKEEWWDVLSTKVPWLLREEYEKTWAEFTEMKSRKQLN